MTRLFKLGTSTSNVSLTNELVSKQHIIDNDDDIKALNSGVLLIQKELPGTVQPPISSKTFIELTPEGKNLVYEYTQPRLKPWIQSEWITSQQLYQVGQLILKQQNLLNKNGLSFCDARPENYFLHGLPRLVDIGSIKGLSRQNYLSFQADFVNHFLAPLSYEQKLGLPVSSFLKARLHKCDNVSLPYMCLKKSPSALSLIFEQAIDRHLSSKISKSSPAFVEYLLATHKEDGKTVIKTTRAAKKTKRLARILEECRPRAIKKTHWSSYSEFHDSRYANNKYNAVTAFIASLDAKTICIDLGSNVSSLDIKGITAFVDRDLAVCNLLRKCSDNNQAVLCADIGYEMLCAANQEMNTCLNLGANNSAAIATSLMHHVIIDQGLPVECFYLSLSRLYSKVLLEFIMPTDPMLRLMIARKDEAILWSWDQHERICTKWFHISEPQYLSSTRFAVQITNRSIR
jgi:hypothetical protein